MIVAGRCGTIQFARVLHAIQLPEALQSWRLYDADAGAGAALDLTVHDVDTLRFLLDDDVTGVVAQCALEGQAVAETALAAVLRMGRGCMAVLQDSLNMRNTSTVVEVHGSSASLIATGVLNQRPQGALVIRDAEGPQDVLLPPLEDAYGAVVRAFTRAVNDPNCSPSATGDDGLASLAVALAVTESCRTGRHVAPTGSPVALDGSA
jgi:1,5-anhydro-D-fructose reductase (1,5-anhydro-D-mannitol-forming)